MEQTFFFTNQCTDFSDGVHFTTVYYNEYGDSFNSWNICLDIENHTLRQDNPSAGEFFVYIKFSSLMYPRIIAAISPICLSPSSGIASVETRV